jgi:nucleoside-diphosphate-sugar epimerase
VNDRDRVKADIGERLGAEGGAMIVLVTGGAGGLGRAVIPDLIEHGYQVWSTDRVPGPDLPCRHVIADLGDLGAVYDVARGAEAIVHLGAIPDAGGHPDHVVFDNNVRATFNVIQAAEALGLARVVCASSLCAVGVPFRPPAHVPHYLPLDEAHPLLPVDPYGLSKVVGEEICTTAARRSGLVAVSLRFTWVVHPGAYQALFEAPHKPDVGNLWTYVDGRDAAVACRLALGAPLTGHHAYYIAADDSFSNTPAAELLAAHYPGVPWRGSDPTTWQAAIDCTAARQELGWTARRHWRSPREME